MLGPSAAYLLVAQGTKLASALSRTPKLIKRLEVLRSKPWNVRAVRFAGRPQRWFSILRPSG
jgi:hypothetical protein